MLPEQRERERERERESFIVTSLCVRNRADASGAVSRSRRGISVTVMCVSESVTVMYVSESVTVMCVSVTVMCVSVTMRAQCHYCKCWVVVRLVTSQRKLITKSLTRQHWTWRCRLPLVTSYWARLRILNVWFDLTDHVTACACRRRLTWCENPTINEPPVAPRLNFYRFRVDVWHHFFEKKKHAPSFLKKNLFVSPSVSLSLISDFSKLTKHRKVSECTHTHYPVRSIPPPLRPCQQ